MTSLKWDATEVSLPTLSFITPWLVLKQMSATENIPLEKQDMQIDFASLKTGSAHPLEPNSFRFVGSRILKSSKKKFSKTDQSTPDFRYLRTFCNTKVEFTDTNQEVCWEDTLSKLLVGERTIKESIGLSKIVGLNLGEKKDTSRLPSENAALILALSA